MNFQKTSVNIYTTEPSKIIINNDTILTKRNKANIIVKRSGEPLKLIVTSDSIKKEVYINPLNSFGYYYNIICNLGIGMIVEKNNPKRYTYQKNLYLNSSDTANIYYRYSQASNKGRLGLHLSFPYINSFFLQPKDEASKSNTGFVGASIGLDYSYKHKKFISFAVTAGADLFAPIGPVRKSAPYEQMNSSYASLTNNYRLKRFMLGYGLCVAKNNWRFIDSTGLTTSPPTDNSVYKASINAGFVFPLRYFTGNNFFVGIIYRPTLLRLNNPVAFNYEHLISFDFG